MRNWPYAYALMQDSASSRGAREQWDSEMKRGWR